MIDFAKLMGAIALATVFNWCGSAAAAESQGVKADLIYHNYCSVCHGDRGDGQSRARNSLIPPPKDFTHAQDLTREYMIKVITDGKPGTAMVGWKTQLGEAEVAAVADYIRTTFIAPNASGPVAVAGLSGIEAHGGRAQDAKGVPAANMQLGFPAGLKGDPTKGERFYRANCATCHGQKGDGQGPRAYFIRPQPRNFLDPVTRQAFNRPALFAAVSMGRQGSEMPAWNKVLSEQEIADVAEFVFQRFIHPDGQVNPQK